MADSPDTNDRVTEALETYYRLKKDYDAHVNNKKKDIIKNKNLSRKEKKRRLIELKFNCVKCEKAGGTIFTSKDGTLRAICGHRASPCDLDIEIKRAKIEIAAIKANV